MRQLIAAASLGLISSQQISRDLSSAIVLPEGEADDAVLDINAGQTAPPEFGYTVNSGACIKLRDNYNIFDLKQLERGEGSSSYARGSEINCIPGDTPGNDDCGADVTSLFLYKVCQPQF